MPRRTYIWKDGQFIEITEEIERAKSTPRGYVIQDSMDAVAHPCTGQKMDSKSSFRKVTKAYGCTEVGNDVQTREIHKPPPIIPDLQKTWEKLYGV